MAYDAFVDSVKLNAALRATASAIRSKTGSSGSIAFNMSTGFASAISSISTGGNVGGYIDATLTSVSSNTTAIRSYCFYGFGDLTSISFPNCETIGQYAFYGCSKLDYAYFPWCFTVGSSAFRGCTSMSTVVLTRCTQIKNHAFYNCEGLIIADGLASVTRVETQAFAYCNNLNMIVLPSAYIIGSSAFMGCTNLSVAYLGQYVSELSMYLSANAFYECNSLESVYIQCSGFASISADTFADTPIMNSTYIGRFGSVYVPVSRYSAYLSRTNWSMISARLVPY